MYATSFTLALAFLLVTCSNLPMLTNCDYIRSNELIINENIDVGSEIINLNTLINNEKQLDISSTLDKSYMFKLVNDTPLISHVELKYVGTTTLVVLSQKLAMDQICPALANSCTQTLKIIAINENDFIEIPIEIRKAKTRLHIQFGQESLSLNATKLTNTYLIETAFVSGRDFAYLADKIEYKAESGDSVNRDYFDFSLLKISTAKLKLVVKFKSEALLLKAYNANTVFELTVRAEFSEKTPLFEADDTFLRISLHINAEDLIPLEPLAFEQPIYSIAYENEAEEEKETIELLRPMLKKLSLKQDIVFSIFQSEGSNTQTHLPFFIDDHTGAISLKRNELDEEKFYSFGIKATYKKLTSSPNKDSANYYHDYMIPAFAKVQISFKRKVVKPPAIQHAIQSPFISKYEILNEESTNRTFILYINDPIELNSPLVKFSLASDPAALMKWNFGDDQTVFAFEFDANYLALFSKVDFKDQRVYRTTLKVLDSSKNRLLSQINVEFRIDFDPLVFDRGEYEALVTPNFLVSQNLVKISVKPRAKKSPKTLDYSKGVVFRLAVDDEFFEIHPTTGWISAKKSLNPSKSVHELSVIGLNSELQKSASVKVKLRVDCYMKESINSTLTFNLFESLPNRTQIGTLKSVCSDMNYLYELYDDSVALKVCDLTSIGDGTKEKCQTFSLDLTKLDSSLNHKLFSVELKSGYLMTNQVKYSFSRFSKLYRNDAYLTWG